MDEQQNVRLAMRCETTVYDFECLLIEANLKLSCLCYYLLFDL